MRKNLGFMTILLLFGLTGCSIFGTPEGLVELSPRSIHIRSEKASASEEIVYCCADVKVTNQGNKTIYDCTVSAVATSDAGIEHYISMHCDVNIPPSQSIYLKIEWQLVKKIETIIKEETETTANGSSTSSSSSSTTTSTTTTETSDSTEESSWDKDSVKILDYFFN